MNKSLFAVILCLFIIGPIYAQDSKAKKMSYGVGLNAAMGGDLGTLGLDLKAEYRILECLGLNINAGATIFSDSFVDYDNSYLSIPITIGANYYFSNRFYAGARTGLSFSEYGKDFLVSPILGIKVFKFMDVAIQYQHYFNSDDHFGLIGIRLGFFF